MSSTISKKDCAALVACLGGAVASYQLLKYLYSKQQRNRDDWVPIGRVKTLYIYPIKSCKAKPVFSLHCGYLCATSHENFDRKFLVTDPNGHFFTGRVKPQLILVESDVRDGILYLSYEGEKAQVPLNGIKETNSIIKATLFRDERQDGFDCGEVAAEFFTKVLGEPARLVMHEPGLYTERKITTKEDWWNNNEVPKRTDDKPYTDNTPYMVTTQASLNDLNERLDEKVESVQFRANIIVDGCPAWDEDRWAELRFGDQPTNDAPEMQCYRPCDRCIMTTINPETGVRHQQEPLKSLREFRMPTGRMAGVFKSPIFGDRQCGRDTNPLLSNLCIDVVDEETPNFKCAVFYIF
ncbi:unnamed protein product, partial [Mesorhabditis belari]|uniref:MOSC domain-containing protein n=1 Tax=Mesorhabditis belari TaxID=2138241 RepID=A0AAF3EQ24_9BILA